MNREEFSNSFDTLVNSYKRFKDFDKQEYLDSIEFNEYEKSLFLTEAQEELLVGLYTGKNQYNEAFEATEELRKYLSNLLVDAELEPITYTTEVPIGLENNSRFFVLPNNLLFIVYENVISNSDDCLGGKKTLRVYPTKYDEYSNIKDNPFRGANNRRALRFDYSNNIVEIISNLDINTYHIRYLRKLNPIILEDLPNDLTIQGKNEASDCELHEMLHKNILNLAVVKALQSKGYIFNNESKKSNN